MPDYFMSEEDFAAHKSAHLRTLKRNNEMNSALFDFGDGPVPAERHPNGNGWVAATASVSRTVYVAPTAMVYGNAKVHGYAHISDYARVYDNAVVDGNACIYGSAKVYGNARVTDRAIIREHAQIYGNAKICHFANISGYVIVRGNAVFDRNSTLWSSRVYEGDGYVGTGTMTKEKPIQVSPIGGLVFNKNIHITVQELAESIRAMSKEAKLEILKALIE